MILNLSHYHTAKRRKIHDRKAAKSKIRLTPICGDMVYSLAGLMILNMTLSFGVYPFLRSRMGAEGSGKMLFFTAIMGLMASAVGSGINYGRMKASTRHETKMVITIAFLYSQHFYVRLSL